MPVKNRIKIFVAGGYYHIYNQGVDKREIFLDEQDYSTFLNLLQCYLSISKAPDSRFKSERPYRLRHRAEMNLTGEISLLAYCLTPTRYDLLVRQNSSTGITKLMRRLVTSYVGYFNSKYHRSGGLYQGVYKGLLLDHPEQIISVTQAIHLSSVRTNKVGLFSTTSGSPETYPYSSYAKYLAKTAPEWLDIHAVLSLMDEPIAHQV